MFFVNHLVDKKITNAKLANVQNSVTAPTPFELKIDGDFLFQQIQWFRKRNSLKEYQTSDFLCKVAEQRLAETKVNWSHDGFYYKRFCDSCTLGENLYRDGKTEVHVLDGWLKSPSHAAALRAPYTHSCLKTDGNYVVHIFGYF